MSNLVNGQGSGRLWDEKRVFGPALAQIAEDRSAKSLNISAALTAALGPKWTAILDGVIARTSAAQPAVGTQEIEGTGTEFYGSAQLVGNGIVGDGDTLVFGVQHADTAKFRITAGDVAMHLPIVPRLSAEPRLRVAHRSDKFGKGGRTTYSAGLRAIYEVSTRTAFDFEIARVWFRQTHDDAVFAGESKERSFALNLGYRVLL